MDHLGGIHAGRFIPALAGNTGSTWTDGAGRPVHPRARGEHEVPPRVARIAAGSSPRSRGTRARCSGCPGISRFIPALAGNTDTHAHSRRSRAVHPRARGEHDLEQDIVEAGGGSSPRSRGTRSSGGSRRGLRRFIPALAGNTFSAEQLRAEMAVHPRARGEHGRKCRVRARAVGSSPRSRGTRAPRHRVRAERRFIPALAGNTLPVSGCFGDLILL